MAIVRSYNPKWFFNDLTGQPLNDEYYAHFLTNTLPYIPQVVYRDPQALTVWTGGVVQFEPSGGLPDNLYFNDELVYRIEIRHGQSQSDALIWEINNYVPEGSGNNPSSANITSDNQVTNPEFVLISFNGTLTSTDNTIQVAPGWEIVATGNGSITVTRTAVAGTDDILTNPAYVLNIVTAGSWSSVLLRQRFEHNGALFRGTSTQVSAVAGSFVAKSNGADFVGGMFYVDSDGNEFPIISAATVTSAYQLFSDAVALPNTPQNPENSDIGYVDLIINIPNVGDVSVTSIQLVKQIEPEAIDYLQEAPARQIDHTWHYYKEQVIVQPKNTILTGWNFCLNPWQFLTTASTNIAASKYTADQTIVSLQTVASLESQKTTEGYFGIQSVTSATQGKFALIQYVDAATIAPYWGNLVSSLVRAGISTAHATGLQIKMRVIYRASAPVAVDPIASWAATDPVFTAGWTALAPQNDPVYVIDGAALENFTFDGFNLPAHFSADAMIGIVLYTTNTLNSAAVADKVFFDRISLVPNAFAVDSQPQTYDQVLRECQFYYETSYGKGVLVNTFPAGGCLIAQQSYLTNGGNDSILLRAFGFPFKTICRTNNPTVTLYNPVNGGSNSVFVQLYNCNTTATIGQDVVVSPSSWVESQKSGSGVSYEALLNAPIGSVAHGAGTPNIDTWVYYHYAKDGRLGIVA